MTMCLKLLTLATVFGAVICKETNRSMLLRASESSSGSSGMENLVTLAHRHHPHATDDLLSLIEKSSFGRNEVINLIVNEYISTSARSIHKHHDLSHWLHKAIEAIEFSETDGEPVQIIGHDFLFVGSVGASRNHNALQRNGITHVVDYSEAARCNLFDDIKYQCVNDVKGHEQVLRHIDELDEAVEFVEAARKSGGRVLSHCWHGENRSVTLLVAYLMKYEGMGADEANDLIKETRPGAKPYWDTLEEYSNHLNEKPLSKA